MTCVLEQQTKMEQVVSSKLATIEGLAQQHSQSLLTLNQRAEASAICTSDAVVLNQQILCQLAEDVRHVKYQMSNPPPPGTLDPTKELPVILEDAFGVQVPIAMDWIRDWIVSIYTLTARGKHSPQHKSVPDIFWVRTSTQCSNGGSKRRGRAKSWSSAVNSPSKIILLVSTLTEPSQ